MELIEALKARRSIRRYKPDKIPDDVLERVLEAARIAPSAGNAQPWKFLVVRDSRLKSELIEACRGQRFIAEADAIIVACGLPRQARHIGGRWSSAQVDVACAFTQLLLQAWQEGLGTCWIGAYDEAKVKRLLNIPDEVEVYALTPLGYPAEQPGPTPRKPLAEIVCYDKWC